MGMDTRIGLLALTLTFGISTAMAAEEAPADAAAKPAGNVEHGMQIFNNVCSHCHHTDHETSSVGAPGLRDVLDRHEVAWINEWISGPEAFSKKDETAKALVNANPYGLIMPTLPDMQDPQNRLDVIEYLKTLKSE